MIRSIIIDDDAINIDMLQNRLMKFCPQVEIISTANSVNEGIEKILLLKPDLIFLDIEIHDKTAFDLLDSLNDYNLNVILCTAYDKYALLGYKYNILGYLLKPIDVAELIRFVSKVEKSINNKIQNEHLSNKNNFEFFKINNKDNIEIIKSENIIYIEAKNSYTEIHLEDNTKRIISKSIGECEDALSQNSFLRVHNSFIININYIVRINKSKYGSITLKNNLDIPISATRKKEVSDRLGI